MTRFTATPGDCIVTSAPPVEICISSKASKSKYTGEPPVADMSVMSTPSRFHFCSRIAAPRATKFDCWPDALPPTFCRSIATPADCSMMTHGSRADGMLCSDSWLNRVFLPVSRRSTSGDSPVTVTVSWSWEISIAALICALKPISIRIPSRTTVLNPPSSNFTVVVADGESAGTGRSRCRS